MAACGVVLIGAVVVGAVSFDAASRAATVAAARRDARLARALAGRLATDAARPDASAASLAELWREFGSAAVAPRVWLLEGDGTILYDSRPEWADGASSGSAAGVRLQDARRATLGELLRDGFAGTVRAADVGSLLSAARIGDSGRWVVVRRGRAELRQEALGRWLPTAAAVAVVLVLAGGALCLQVLWAHHHRRRALERERTQTLAALGRLAGGVAHDFNNLLTGMSGFLDLALARLGDEHEAAADLREVRLLVERAGGLVRRLLAFGRPTAGAPRAVDLGAHVREAAGWLGPMLGEEIVLLVEVPARPVVVHIDPVQLDQVLLNLAANARDAMPRGGTLRCSVEWNGADSEAVLRVADTGTGMDAATRRRLFEPYFTTKAEGGTGLGLAVVHGVVTGAGGSIEVHSARGEGTEFVIRLPLAPSP